MRIWFVMAFGLTLCMMTFLAGFADEPAPPKIEGDDASRWRRSIGGDDYRRVMEIRVSDFADEYEVDQPIPVAAEIRNLGPLGENVGHPDAQIRPRIEVWVAREGERSRHGRYQVLPDDKILLEPGETLEGLFDLRKVVDLSRPGDYRVTVGYSNSSVSDLGDWTGVLRSTERIVRVRAKAEGK